MKSLVATLLITLSISLTGQSSVYVSSSSLNLRDQASLNGQVIHSLVQYDNLTVTDTIGSDWLKVSFGRLSGFVSKNYVKSGKAKATIVSGGRIGAICKDGTRSSATGRGACSHHGGVSRWLYSEKKIVEIFEN